MSDAKSQRDPRSDIVRCDCRLHTLTTSRWGSETEQNDVKSRLTKIYIMEGLD